MDCVQAGGGHESHGVAVGTDMTVVGVVGVVEIQVAESKMVGVDHQSQVGGSMMMEVAEDRVHQSQVAAGSLVVEGTAE